MSDGFDSRTASADDGDAVLVPPPANFVIARVVSEMLHTSSVPASQTSNSSLRTARQASWRKFAVRASATAAGLPSTPVPANEAAKPSAPTRRMR
jgi:hypothetical protein